MIQNQSVPVTSKFSERVPENTKHLMEIIEVLSLQNAMRWQWIRKLVLFLGRTKLLKAQWQWWRGFFVCLICLLTFHVSPSNSNPITLRICCIDLLQHSWAASRHVPARGIPAFSFSSISSSINQQEIFLLPFGLLILQLLLCHSNICRAKRAGG